MDELELRRELDMLRAENKAAILTIDKLLKDLGQKSEKIKHLESLVAQNVPVIKKKDNKITVAVSAEEEIAVLQLDRLKNLAQQRTLTLEETRMFDLLVKNKRLVLDESTINLTKQNFRDVSEADLLQIASTEEKNESEK